jgi:hypothetical protein
MSYFRYEGSTPGLRQGSFWPKVANMPGKYYDDNEGVGGWTCPKYKYVLDAYGWVASQLDFLDAPLLIPAHFNWINTPHAYV